MLLRGIDSCSPIDPSIRVSRSGKLRRLRVLYRLQCSEASSLGVHNNSVDNVCRGVTERVLNEEVDGQWIPVRQPSDEAFLPKVVDFTRACGRFIFPTTSVSPQTIVDSYTGRKRQIYQRALESLGVQAVRPRDARLKTFVKCEKVDFAAKVDPAPRIIQPRDPRFNLSLAVYLKPLEHRIYEMINRTFSEQSGLSGPTVMKGLNADEQGAAISLAWSQFNDPVAIDLDASRWDRHVSPAALRWEHSQYLRWFSGHDRLELARLLSWQLDNECVAFCPDGRVRFRVKGRRASGDMNTAVGNVEIMCALAYGYFPNRLPRFRLINNGDDSVLVTERKYLQRIDDMQQWFLEAGFLLKKGPVVDVLEQVVFCQTQPVFVGSGYRMCRDPRVVLSKDSVSILPLRDEVTARKWMHAVGSCGLSLAGDIPVLNEFYSWMVRNGCSGGNIERDPTMETGMRWLARGMHAAYAEPSTETRVSFWRAFGIDGTKQRALEERYVQLPFRFQPVDLPAPNPYLVRPDYALGTRYRQASVSGPKTGSLH